MTKFYPARDRVNDRENKVSIYTIEMLGPLTRLLKVNRAHIFNSLFTPPIDIFIVGPFGLY